MVSKKIKESKIDAVFSTYLRQKANYTCERCGFKDTPPTFKIQASHFYSRVARSVRWDVDNVDVLCQGCHFYLEGRKNGEYYDWKIKKLGTKKFNELKKRYYTLKQWSIKEKQELLNKYK